MADVKAVSEVRALERFYHTLSNDEDRAAYGFEHVFYADDHLAVDELLVTDKLFLAADVHLRRKYVNLVESVREHSGKVFVFSSMHVSGEQLDQYTGVAATLRFPLVVPDEDTEDEEDGRRESEGLRGGAGSEGFGDDDDLVGEDRRRRLSSADELQGFHIDALGLGL
ncbi:pelo-1 [Symbiodinium microadriaticum]|nr:pelo-1 [Symbiodinium microadriaticum]